MYFKLQFMQGSFKSMLTWRLSMMTVKQLKIAGMGRVQRRRPRVSGGI